MNQQQLLLNMDIIEEIIQKVNQQEFTTLYKFLRERIEYPESFVTMLGETSSGKSSLINGLLGKELLYAAPQPTTGTVIEIMDDPELEKIEYYAVTKEATISQQTEESFRKLSIQLPEQYERLRMYIPSFPKGLQGMRMFDTPGYGAIQDEHEEIIKSFLPNSDMIIYVINYRVGLKQSDAEFLSLIQELLREDMKFYLVINRVPEKVTKVDSRIKEITDYVHDLLHQNIPVYLVHSVMPLDDQPTLPFADQLWQDVKKEIASEERQQALETTFLTYQKSLLYEIQGFLENKKLAYMVSDEERKLVEEALDELLEKKLVIEEKMEETFKRVSATSKKMFVHSGEKIVRDLETEITVANKWTNQQECAGYVEAHLMPMLAKKETKNVQYYIEKELDKLNEEIESILNAAIQHFEKRITLDSKAFDRLVINVGHKVAQRVTDTVLQNFFKQYGGAGGAGAGVANAAKKGLKKLGDLVGKTFSRDTHNALAKFLSKIGATSTRAIGMAAVVFVEAAFYLYEVKVWQKKLAKNAKKAITTWVDKSGEAVESDLADLKQHNLEEMDGIFEEYKKAFTLEQYTDTDGNLAEVDEQLVRVQEALTRLEVKEKQIS
jgi:predicted GTPase